MKITPSKKKAVELDWGPVKVTRGIHAGRIGYFDDTDGSKGIVYFGDLFYTPGYYLIPLKSLASVTTDDLIARNGELFHLIGFPHQGRPHGSLGNAKQHIEHLTEHSYVQSVLAERMFKAQRMPGTGQKIFISHSSKDKQFATWLSVDLANLGHDPWLDEWKIRAGESIPTKIAEGLEQCDYIVVVLSEHALASKWVEREWQAKYWSEISNEKVTVIPALLKKCEIPFLLRTKKYADFTESYNDGLDRLLHAVSAS